MWKAAEGFLNNLDTIAAQQFGDGVKPTQQPPLEDLALDDSSDEVEVSRVATRCVSNQKRC